jgi:hypothetical protein
MHCQVIKFKFVKEHFILVIILKNVSSYLIKFYYYNCDYDIWKFLEFLLSINCCSKQCCVTLNRNTTSNGYTNNDVVKSTSCSCVVFRNDDLQDT